MKKLLPFFLLLSFFLTPTFASASALTRESQLVNQALNSSANTAFNDVRVMNGTVTATVDQRVSLAGSSAILSQPVSFAADYAAMARSAASLATRMAAGLAVPLAVGWAIKKLLDGAGYVLGDGGKIIKKPDSDGGRYAWVGATAAYSDYQSALKNSYAHNINQGPYTQQFYNVTSVQACSRFYSSVTSQLVGDACVYYSMNPYYNPDSPVVQQEVTQQQTEDAFLDWMRNNPTNITDPVSQAMYTPAQTTGWNLTGEEGAHHGVDGITDEIAKNILDHRNAALQQPKSYTLNDSVQPTTQVTPDGSSTTTTNNPDGSTTKRTTTTTTDPDTGKQTSTTTTTVTQPDGTSKTTTETTTTDATKTKTDIPAACEWFSTACEWFNWTQKDDSITDNPQIDQSDLPTPTLSENAVSWGSQCPNPQLINFNLMGQTANIQLSWTPVCTLLSYLYYPILAGAYIAAAYIVIGAYKS